METSFSLNGIYFSGRKSIGNLFTQKFPREPKFRHSGLHYSFRVIHLIEPNSRAPVASVLLNLFSMSRISDKILAKPRISSIFTACLITSIFGSNMDSMRYHLLEHQDGIETQTRKARVRTTPEGSSRY